MGSMSITMSKLSIYSNLTARAEAEAATVASGFANSSWARPCLASSNESSACMEPGAGGVWMSTSWDGAQMQLASTLADSQVTGLLSVPDDTIQVASDSFVKSLTASLSNPELKSSSGSTMPQWQSRTFQAKAAVQSRWLLEGLEVLTVAPQIQGFSQLQPNRSSTSLPELGLLPSLSSLSSQVSPTLCRSASTGNLAVKDTKVHGGIPRQSNPGSDAKDAKVRGGQLLGSYSSCQGPVQMLSRASSCVVPTSDIPLVPSESKVRGGTQNMDKRVRGGQLCRNASKSSLVSATSHTSESPTSTSATPLFLPSSPSAGGYSFSPLETSCDIQADHSLSFLAASGSTHLSRNFYSRSMSMPVCQRENLESCSNFSPFMAGAAETTPQEQGLHSTHSCHGSPLLNRVSSSSCVEVVGTDTVVGKIYKVQRRSTTGQLSLGSTGLGSCQPVSKSTVVPLEMSRSSSTLLEVAEEAVLAQIGSLRVA